LFKIKGSASLSKAPVVFYVTPVLHDGEKDCEIGGTLGLFALPEVTLASSIS
jgi:hypothetical protein